MHVQEAENNAVRQNRLVDHLKSETANLKLEVDARGNTIANLSDKVSKCINLQILVDYSANQESA